MSTRELVATLYEALASGDRDTVELLLHPAFEGTLAEGMPHGTGGVHRGPEAMIENGWWALGRRYAVRPVPAEWVDCSDGRLLVLGRYVGKSREAGEELDAVFAHLWTSDGERLTSVWQVTDTAQWPR